MQAKIDTLRVKDENGDECLLYPRTLMQSVIDGDGNTLDSKLTDLERRVDSAGSGGSGEGGTITISSEADNAIESKPDGIYVADNSAEIAQIQNDLAPITKYQKYVNTELKHGQCGLNEDYTPVPDELVPFVLKSGNIRMIDSKVIMQPGQTFQFNISIAYQNTSHNNYGNVEFALCDLTNDITIGFIKPNGGNAQYEGPYTQFYQYTNNADSECEIGLKVDTIFGNDTIHAHYTTFAVQEIGRAITIDPLNYVNESQGIEDAPVGHIISFMGNNAPDHYLACDGTLYNISDYPYLVQHFIDQFGSVNHFGGDGTTTFAVPALAPAESALYCIKYEPTYFMVYKDYNTNYLQPTLYSEEERIVGCWINGKPLYEKSFVFTGSYGTEITSIPLDIVNVDDCFISEGRMINSYGAILPINYTNPASTNGVIACFIAKDATSLEIRFGSAYSTNPVTDIQVTIKYTKTTDAEDSFTTQMITDYAVAGYDNTVFPDYTNELAKITTAGATYTATENCVVRSYVEVKDGYTAIVFVDELEVHSVFDGAGSDAVHVGAHSMFYMRAGQTLTTRADHGIYDLTIYGLQS